MIKTKASKEHFLLFCVMLLSVPLAGELKFHPFHGDFRVSFGTPAFFLFLLWLRNSNPIVCGFLVGIIVVAFRVSLDLFEPEKQADSIKLHAPAFFYYLTYASAFHLTKIRRFFYERPIWIGIFGTIIEIIASISEIFVRSILSDESLSMTMIQEIAIIAVIRTFFVLGIFTIFMVRETNMIVEQERRRNEEMTVLISTLYEESIQLKKSMRHAEDVTRDCYNLYRQLKESSNVHAKSALKIAGQVHEIKKDSYRIYAGLSQLISHESIKEKMSIEELGQLILTSNKKYAKLIGKEIDIELKINGSHPCYHPYPILSLVNNLVSNSIEAIGHQGIITILFTTKREHLKLCITDNGPGIPEKNLDLIYQHGFTTKYDLSGKPSTGIGLSYVRDLVTSLDGTITVHSPYKGCTFCMEIPLKQVTD